MDEFFVCSFEGTIYLQYGPVAQLVRAPPCHGGGREFESLLGRLRWGLSSAGRASALQAEGHRFEPCRPHLLNKDGFPSGQRGQTVNLLAPPSKVRILLHPYFSFAAVAEQADAQDLKSCGTYTPVPVRFRFAALCGCSSAG